MGWPLPISCHLGPSCINCKGSHAASGRLSNLAAGLSYSGLGTAWPALPEGMVHCTVPGVSCCGYHSYLHLCHLTVSMYGPASCYVGCQTTVRMSPSLNASQGSKKVEPSPSIIDPPVPHMSPTMSVDAPAPSPHAYSPCSWSCMEGCDWLVVGHPPHLGTSHWCDPTRGPSRNPSWGLMGIWCDMEDDIQVQAAQYCTLREKYKMRLQYAMAFPMELQWALW